MRSYLLYIIIFICLIGCSRKDESILKTEKQYPKYKKITIVSTKLFNGFLNGVSFDKCELYIGLVIPRKKNHATIDVIDLDTEKIINSLNICKGEGSSPTCVVEPSYVLRKDKFYFIRDSYYKIIIFDQNLKHLFSSIIDLHIYFMDFFIRRNKIMLLIGHKYFTGKEYLGNIRIFNINKNKRPDEVKTLHKLNIIGSWHLGDYNNPPEGYLWPSAFGFEKDGKIFFSIGFDENIYSYDIETSKTQSIKFNFLKAIQYENRQADKVGKYHALEHIKYSKLSKKQVQYIAYPKKVYNFGIYDVGRGKIGIVSKINFKKMKFQLDIVETKNFDYQYSIFLPIGRGFLWSISYNNNLFNKTFINVDKGIYIWWDMEEKEKGDYWVKLTKFKFQSNNSKN